VEVAIIPDLPPQESHEFLDAMDAINLAPILVFFTNGIP
jgi:tryptophan synthase alpha subunit